MTTIGSGIFLHPSEQELVRINAIVRQLIEGRSNAVGSVTLTADGAATSTVVSNTAHGTTAAIVMYPMTANAASVVATTYIQQADITKQQFYVTHNAVPSTNTDVTFYWMALG